MDFTSFEAAHFLVILPEIILVGIAALVMTMDVVQKGESRRMMGYVTALGFLAALLIGIAVAAPSGDPKLLFGGTIRSDMLGFVFRAMFLVAGAVTAVLTSDVKGLGKRGDFFAVLIATVIGMNFMAIATDLIMLYLAMETTSISAYALTGFLLNNDRSAESGLKYFLFGAVTSTVMLFGFSLLYGLTGHTNLYGIAEALSAGNVSFVMLIGIAIMILVGIGFKLSAFPFHFWTPDVYEGAPTPITAFISTASKTAGFIVLLRVFIVALSTSSGVAGWLPLIMAIAAVTTTLGNLVALAQTNIKRLLAYSSIAHAGYTLMAFVAFQQAPEESVSAVTFYLMTYILTNLLAFAVVILFAKVAGSDEIADYAGMSRRSPNLALVMLIAFLSLAGIPPLAGFLGKFFIFKVVMDAGLVWLAIVGALNALVALYYYLVVMKVVYVDPAPEGAPRIPIATPYRIVLAVLTVGVIVLGTAATPFYNWAIAGASSFF